MEFYKALEILMEDATPDGVNCWTAGDRYGHGNACEIESGIFYFSFTIREKPQLIIQSGCHKGFDSSFMGLGLQFNSIAYPELKGHLVTIDIDDHRPQELWSRLELGPDIITHIIGDATKLETYRHKLSQSVSWYHADCDHDGPTLLAEFHNIYPYLDRHRCIFSSHDTRLDTRLQPAILQIKQELLQLRDQGRGWAHVNHFFMRNLRGIDFFVLSNEAI